MSEIHMNPQETRRDGMILLALCSILFLLHLGGPGLWDPDETRYGEIAREMLERGDFIIPHHNAIPNLDKPPLYPWLIAVSYMIFGVNEFATRLPNVCLALLSLVVLYRLGRLLFDSSTGRWGACVLATSVLFTALARVATIDMTLGFCITLALYFFALGYFQTEKRTRNFLLMYLFVGLAMMAKGPIGVFIPAATILAFLVLREELRFLGKMRILSGIGIFLAVVAPWYIMVSLREPSFVSYFFINQNVEAFLQGDVHHPKPWYMSFVLLLGGFMPWSPFLLALTGFVRFKGLFKLLRDHASVCFLICWAMVPLVVFTLSQVKLGTYFLPSLPPLALLLIHGWKNLLEMPDAKRVIVTHRIVLALFAGGGIGAAIWLRQNPADLETLTERGASLIPIVVGMAFLVVATVAALLLTIRRRWRLGACVMIAAYLVMAVTAYMVMQSVEEVRCARNLARKLQPHLRQGDAVASYRSFSDGLAFYLRRPVIVVAKVSDYRHGLTMLDDPKKYSLYEKELWTLVRTEQRVFIVLRKEVFVEIPGDVQLMLHRVDEDSQNLVLANAAVSTDGK